MTASELAGMVLAGVIRSAEVIDMGFMSLPPIEIQMCNVCKHAIHQPTHSSDWVCTHRCRCVMIGCIPWDERYVDGKGIQKEHQPLPL